MKLTVLTTVVVTCVLTVRLVQSVSPNLVVEAFDVLRNEIGEGVGIRWPHWHQDNPDESLTAPELIQKYGYPAEVHHVTTDDGYILTMHRIPHGKNQSVGGQRPVVFLQHGLFSSSVDWILNRVDKALPYMLADSGYDVWMGNARGNGYSKNHTTLKPEQHEFWQFSFHEMGVHDLPAEFNYILNRTGNERLNYIGHSMGTTMFFICLATLPEYNHKINFMAGLGPAVYLNHMKGPAKYLAPLASAEKFIFDVIGHGELLPLYVVKYINTYAPEFCTEEMTLANLCENFFFLLCGFDGAQANMTELPVILAHTPTTSSSKTVVHFLQETYSGKFRQYDYGFLMNKHVYGQWTPPKYDLSKVKVPVALYHAPNDLLVDPVDVARLAKDLPALVGNFQVNLTHFNHIDFLFAVDVDKLVNRPLVNMLKSFNRFH